MPEYIVHFAEEIRSKSGTLEKVIYSTKAYHAENIEALADLLWMNIPSSKVDKIIRIHTESDAQIPTDRAERVKKEIRGNISFLTLIK